MLLLDHWLLVQCSMFNGQHKSHTGTCARTSYQGCNNLTCMHSFGKTMATEAWVHQVLRFLVIKSKALDKDLVVEEQGQKNHW